MNHLDLPFDLRTQFDIKIVRLIRIATIKELTDCMSRNSRRRKRRGREKALREAGEMVSQLIAAANQNPNQNPSGGDPKQKKQKVGIANWKKLLGFVIASGMGVLINKLSGGAWAWWIPAIALCIWIFDATAHFKGWRLAMIPVYAGILFSTHRFIKVISKTPEPVLTLDVGQAIFPKDPFGTTFTLVNHGPGSIYHIRHAGWWNDPKGRGKRLLYGFEMTNELTELKPFVKQELWVDPDAIHAPLADFTRLDIAVRYTLENLQNRTNYYQFRVTKIGENYNWIPYGDGEPIDKAFERIPRFPPPKTASETNPAISIKFVSLRKSTNDSYPAGSTELKISLENTGGYAAYNITGQWAIIRKEDGFVQLLTGKSDFGLNGHYLIPGAISSNDCYFSPELTNFYEGILSGSNVFIGKIQYGGWTGTKFVNVFQIGNKSGRFKVESINPRTEDPERIR